MLRLKCPVRMGCLSGDNAVIAGLMAQRIPFIVAELGTDPFMLHLYRRQQIVVEYGREMQAWSTAEEGAADCSG